MPDLNDEQLALTKSLFYAGAGVMAGLVIDTEDTEQLADLLEDVVAEIKEYKVEFLAHVQKVKNGSC